MNHPAARYHFLHDNLAFEAYKILRGHAHNANRKLGIDQSSRSLAILKWNDAKGMIAGACGVAYCGWFSLDLLWVEEPYRKQGIGSELLKIIEGEAMKLGAHSAYLWSQEFEAPDFYRKYGYQEFVRLNEFLPGHQLIGMQKKLIT